MFSDTYLNRDSFIHRLDPRIKLFFLLFFSIFFFLPLILLKYYGVVLLIFLTGIISIGFKEIVKPLKMISPILILIILLTPPFYPDGEAYLILFNYPLVTDKGLYQAFFLIGRFSGLTLLFYLFLRTVKMEDFALSLRFFKLPYTATLVISLTFRYLPYAASIYENTTDAHKMRLTNYSEPVSKWNFPARFKKLLSILTSVLIQSVKSIPNLAMVLETRGIGRNSKPGKMKKMAGIKKLSRQLIFSFFVLSVIICYIFV
ncbi:MAG: energy-coupling factor transporter transmembrane protein EcfT [Spirochaetes bacterium]|nr:energy-coupling factor transporter transmembrane protein EcfT [Spirochaetota bacterium]